MRPPRQGLVPIRQRAHLAGKPGGAANYLLEPSAAVVLAGAVAAEPDFDVANGHYYSQAGGFAITYLDWDDASPERGAWDPAVEAANADKAINAVTGRLTEKNLDIADVVVEVAKEIGCTPAQLALGWVLARGDHIVTIPGTASIAHLEENVARQDYLPPSDVTARVDALINETTVAGPRYPESMQRTIDTEAFA
mgnify:CR=1 FL=1